MRKTELSKRWRARLVPVGALVSLLGACGGKALEDAPNPPEPSARAEGGGSAAESSGGSSALRGGTASGGGAGGAPTDGTSAGSSSTGGRAMLGKPVYFKRGSARLSPELFRRTLERLFDVALELPAERGPLVFTPGIDPKLGASTDSAQVSLAQGALELVTDDALARALGCDDTSSSCREAFLEGFAARAFRRPLDDAERATLEASFDRAEPGGELVTLRRVTFEVIASPSAYRLGQMGSSEDGAHYVLGGYELASLLSYGVAGEPPDAELTQLAGSDALADPEQRVEQLERLLAKHPRPAPLEAKIRDWLWIRDAEALPSFATDPDLAKAMIEETSRLIADVVSENAPIARLLDADYTFVNPSLAELYGLDVNAAGDEFERVELRSTRRRGILHHASFLTSASWWDIPNYAHRGGAVAGTICVEIPREPDNVAPSPPPGGPPSTGRQRYEAIVGSSTCAGCHRLVDPIGYGFDRFDAAGRYRETDAGVAIDTSGELTLPELELKFESSMDLVEGLATDPRYTGCFVRRAAESFIGSYSDPAAVDYASREIERGASTRLVDILAAWVASDHFEIRVE